MFFFDFLSGFSKKLLAVGPHYQYVQAKQKRSMMLLSLLFRPLREAGYPYSFLKKREGEREDPEVQLIPRQVN